MISPAPSFSNPTLKGMQRPIPPTKQIKADEFCPHTDLRWESFLRTISYHDDMDGVAFQQNYIIAHNFDMTDIRLSALQNATNKYA